MSLLNVIGNTHTTDVHWRTEIHRPPRLCGVRILCAWSCIHVVVDSPWSLLLAVSTALKGRFLQRHVFVCSTKRSFPTQMMKENQRKYWQKWMNGFDKQIRKVLWTRKGLPATVVTAGHCTVFMHALASCYSCCVHSIRAYENYLDNLLSK